MNSIVSMPLTMIGASSDKNEWKEILSNSTLVFLLTGVFLSITFLLISLFLAEEPYKDNGVALRVLSIIVVPYIGQEYTRRILLTKQKVYFALFCDFLTCGSRLAAIPVMSLWDLASHDFVIYLLGATSLAGMIAGTYWIRFPFTCMVNRLSKVNLIRIWRVAKWTFADWVPFVVYGQLYIYIVTFTLGNQANSVLGVCRNFIAPVMVLEMGLTSYLVPANRLIFNDHGANRTISSILKVFFIITFPVASYLIAVSIFASELMGMLFTAYLDYSYAVIYFSIGMFVNYAFAPAQIFLLSALKPKTIFYARVIAATLTIFFCYPLVKLFGINGALYCFIFSHFIMCLAVYYFVFKYFQKQSERNITLKGMASFFLRILTHGWLRLTSIK